jgi:hypothetical protein
MDEKEKRLRKAIAELHRYAKNPNNPLQGPAFSELVDEFNLASDALSVEEEELSDSELEV